MPAQSFPGVNVGSVAAVTLAIKASVAASTVVRPNPGTLLSMVITTSAGGIVQIYDTSGTTAAGTMIASTGLAAAVGTVYAFPLGQPAVNGMLAVSSASSPAVTITFA